MAPNRAILPPPRMSPERPRRILVVDDSRAIHQDFRRILAGEASSRGLSEMEAVLFGTGDRPADETYTVDSAYQGQEAVERVRAAVEGGSPYPLAFVDMRMPPGDDGLQTIEKIWQVDREIQIVLCTAYSDFSREDMARRFGATDQLLLLKKPFDVGEVRQLASALTEKWHLARRAEALRATLAESTAAAWSAKEQLDDLLDSASDLILSAAPDGRLLYVNRAFRETLGYDAGDVARLGLFDLLAPPSRADWTSAFWLLREGRPGVRREGSFLRKDGRVAVLDGTITCRREAGQPVAMRAILRDVTEQRRAEEQIRRYADLIENIHIGLLVWQAQDPHDAGTFRLVAENKAALRLFAVEPGAARLGRPFRETHPLLFEQGLHNEYAEVLRTGEGVTVEHKLQDLRYFAVSIFPLPGSCVGVAFEDVSARRELEGLKDDFVSTVSHELRTPLTSIRGALALLVGGVLGPLPADVMELVQIARTNSERLIRLINDLLDLEKIQKGRMEYRHARIDVQRLVCSAVDGVRAIAAEAGVGMHTDFHGPETVHGDEGRLVQVLTNLMSNAIKFSPCGSFVEVEVVLAAPGRARFSVTDRGPGIAPAQLPRLFGKFQQIDSSNTRAKGGTGLGLAISKAIVEAHGGAIGVESRPGEGSRFWFEVPTFDLPA